MYLYKLIAIVSAILVVSTATIVAQSDDLQAEETNVVHMRQKRAPLLLKKLLIGGLIAKKALVLGGGGGLIGAGVGTALKQKFSRGNQGHPIYINNNNPSPPIYQDRPPVYHDYPSPISVQPARPPVYYDQYPSPPATNPNGNYGPPVYINLVHPKPPPSFPPINSDCYTGSSSLNPSYNSALSSRGYA